MKMAFFLVSVPYNVLFNCFTNVDLISKIFAEDGCIIGPALSLMPGGRRVDFVQLKPRVY